MKSMIYVEGCDNVEVVGNVSNNDEPLLVAKKIKKLTTRNNISSSKSTPYDVQDCGEFVAENNINLNNQKKQSIIQNGTTPSIKLSIIYTFVMRAIYGKQ